jgi:hypothetical protein
MRGFFGASLGRYESARPIVSINKERNVENLFSDILVGVRSRVNLLSGFQPSILNRWLVRSWMLSENVIRG